MPSEPLSALLGRLEALAVDADGVVLPATCTLRQVDLRRLVAAARAGEALAAFVERAATGGYSSVDADGCPWCYSGAVQRGLDDALAAWHWVAGGES